MTSPIRPALVLPALCATASAVALQIVLPRIFSVVLWYHLGFFAVGLAMLGGAAGALFARKRLRADPDASAVDHLPHAALATAVALVLALRLEIDPRDLMAGLGAPLKLLALPLLLAIPFAALGATSSLALARAGDALPRVYAATFGGGAAGALIGFYCMETIGAPRTLGVLVLLPLLGTLSAGRSKIASGPSLAAIVFGSAILVAPTELLPTRSSKHFPQVEEAAILAERWNAASRVTFYRNPERHGLWEMPLRYSGPLPESIGVVIDAWAITSILKIASPVEALFFGAYPPTLAFSGATRGFSTLVIGAGGGVDVEAALAAGAGHVTAVEINPLIVDGVRGDFKEWSSDLYGRPEVTVVTGEGRHFAESIDTRFDRIVLTGVDTFAASEAGAFALSENYLYTVEAMKVWLSRLEPGGRVSFTRWWYEPPRQTLRLILTLDRAMRELGVEHPDRRIVVSRTALNSVVVVKDGDFTPEETAELVAGMPKRGLSLVLAPGVVEGDPRFREFLDPARQADLIAGWPYRVEPCTDDRPFFFEYTRLARLFATEGDWIHDRLGGTELVIVTLLSILLLGAPLVISALRAARVGVESTHSRLIISCLLLGIGYLLVEAPLLSRLSLVLGHPGRAISVVLVVLLLGSGVGAFVAGRIDPARAAKAAFAAAIVVAAVLALGYTELLGAVRTEPIVTRSFATVVYLAVPAFVLGIPFPLALRAANANGDTIAAATVVNGVGSALAGPLAALLALEFGFTATLCAAALCYAVAALILPSRTASEGASARIG